MTLLNYIFLEMTRRFQCDELRIIAVARMYWQYIQRELNRTQISISRSLGAINIIQLILL
jgi:hypothetical protein